MSTNILLPLAVNSKSERKVDSLPPLGFEPATFSMLAHLSNRSAKSHPLQLHYVKWRLDFLKSEHIYRVICAYRVCIWWYDTSKSLRQLYYEKWHLNVYIANIPAELSVLIGCVSECMDTIPIEDWTQVAAQGRVLLHHSANPHLYSVLNFGKKKCLS
jgi:hypothetical protein